MSGTFTNLVSLEGYKIEKEIMSVSIRQFRRLFALTLESFPAGDAPTYVNGQLIAEETVLHHVSDVTKMPLPVRVRLLQKPSPFVEN